MLHFVLFHSHRLWRFECTFQWSDQHHCYNVWFHGHLQLWPRLHPGWKYITYMPVQWAVVWFTALLQWWVISADSPAHTVDIVLSSIAIDCGGLSVPSNGQISITATTFGSVATYSCDRGYTLDGNTSRICQSNGQWSGPQPSCVGECLCNNKFCS